MNYIGSKYSLMPFLEQTIDGVVGDNGKGGIFADLFAGTGIVGATYRQKGYTVIANDIQHYAYAFNHHYIVNTPPMNSEHVEWLNSLDGEDGFVYKNYCAGSGSGRNYFSDENGQKCDAMRNAINKLLAQGKINEDEYYYYLAGLINSIDKVANTASVYGAYLKHIKPSAKKKLVIKLLPLIYGKRGQAFRADISEIISTIRGDVLYLDPPYNSRQYCSNYHVLETISRYDSPVLSGVTGLRNSTVDKQKSLFCSKRTVSQAFEAVIAQADFKYIFLSYNNEGLMSLETIKEIMKRYGKYEQFSQNFHRFRADKENARIHKADSTTEFIHVCIK